MTLSCRVPGALARSGGVSWYHNDKLLRKKSEEILIKESGDYKCKTRGSSPSDSVRVQFSSSESGSGGQGSPTRSPRVALRETGRGRPRGTDPSSTDRLGLRCLPEVTRPRRTGLSPLSPARPGPRTTRKCHRGDTWPTAPSSWRHRGLEQSVAEDALSVSPVRPQTG